MHSNSADTAGVAAKVKRIFNRFVPRKKTYPIANDASKNVVVVQASALLNLPAEIRNRIVEYALGDASLVVLVSTRSKPKSIRQIPQPALTLTCKQLRTETLPVFHSRTRFVRVPVGPETEKKHRSQPPPATLIHYIEAAKNSITAPRGPADGIVWMFDRTMNPRLDVKDVPAFMRRDLTAQKFEEDLSSGCWSKYPALIPIIRKLEAERIIDKPVMVAHIDLSEGSRSTDVLVLL